MNKETVKRMLPTVVVTLLGVVLPLAVDAAREALAGFVASYPIWSGAIAAVLTAIANVVRSPLSR